MRETSLLKLRKILDFPFKKKPLWFKFLFPFLFLLSFIIASIAKYRRKAFEFLSSNDLTTELKIICVGNILIGGTGKSPIVQKIAQEYLQLGFVVAIASRGMTKHKTPVYIHFSRKEANDIQLLSDENREHYEILSLKNLSKNIFILQNKNRNESLSYFKKELKKYGSKPAVFILDDGLQHFACPRHINLCVWQPDLLLNSPPYTMPIGPYREGFGKESFQELLDKFEYRIWSRSKEKDLSSFIGKIIQALQPYSLIPSSQDIIASYHLNTFKIKYKNDKYALVNTPPPDILNIQSAAVVTGIAQPDSFLTDLKSLFLNCQNWSVLFLNDHAEFKNSSSSILEKIKNNSTCIFTLKDFFRWCDEETFKTAIANKTIFGCSVELKFYDILSNEIDLIQLMDNSVHEGRSKCLE